MTDGERQNDPTMSDAETQNEPTMSDAETQNEPTMSDAETQNEPTMSDAETQNEPTMSDAETQNEPTMEKKRHTDDRWGTSGDNNGFYNQTIFNDKPPPDADWPKGDQNNETSPTDVINGKKRSDEKIVPMTDGLKENVVPNNNENVVQSAATVLNTAIIILPIQSNLFGKIFK